MQYIRVAYLLYYIIVCISSVQSLSHIWFFTTPWTAARQTSLSITNSRSLPRLMSIESVIPSNHLILCRPFSSCPQIPPSIRETLSTQQLSKEGIKSRIIQLPCVIGGCFCFAICIHSFILFFRFHIEVIIVICPFLSDLLH